MNWFEIFRYEDGKLFWKVSLNSRIRIGDEAGTSDNKGHLVVGYKRKMYKVHRVIYEIFHGPIPKGMAIDHINGIKYDNRVDNLRLVTRSQNMWNSCKPKTNTSGFKGVSWDKRNKQWLAYIAVFGKEKNLGRFSTKEEAYSARLDAEKFYHGEFAASEERKEVEVK